MFRRFVPCCFLVSLYSLFWPGLLFGQEVQAISLKRVPISMGQRWVVKQGAQFELDCTTLAGARVLDKRKVISSGKVSYGARALSVTGTKVSALAVDFGEMLHELETATGKARQEDPLSSKAFTVQHFGGSYYFLDDQKAVPKQDLCFSILDRVREEFEPLNERHSLLGELPQRPLSMGESFPLKNELIARLFGSPYKGKKGRMTLRGTKLVDGVACALFDLRFKAEVRYSNGVELSVTCKGTLCVEVATSRHRSVRCEGEIVIGGEGLDEAGNALQFKGTGKLSLFKDLRYPVKKLAPIKLGRVVPGVNQRWKEFYQRSGNLLRQVKKDGQLILNERVKDAYSNNYSVKVLACSKEAITKAEVSFGRAVSKSLAPEVSEKVLPFSQKVFVLEKTGPGSDVKSCRMTKRDGSAVEGDLGELVYDKVKDLFKVDRSEILGLMPQRALAFGELITIDPKAALKLYGKGDKDLKSASMKLVYRGLRQVNGRSTAVFRFASSLRGEDGQGLRVRIEATGELLFDVKTGWPVGLTRSGYMNIEGEKTNQIGEKIEIRAYGPISTKARIDYVFRKKRF